MFEKKTLYSAQLERDVRLYIFRPDGDEPCPVLYMHEGGMYYYGDYPGANGEKLRYSDYYALHTDDLPRAMIVGIEPPADRRARTAELTPFTKDFEPNGADFAAHISGKGKELAEWIVNDLKSFIDSSYATLPDRANTAIGGCSSGALNAMYCAMAHSDVFGHLQMQSPAFNLWLDEVREMAAQHDFSDLLSCYTNVGTNDFTRMTTAEQAMFAVQEIHTLMTEHGLKKEADRFEIIEDGKHEPEWWHKTFPNAIRWTFGGRD